jgi:hypothetical protein
VVWGVSSVAPLQLVPRVSVLRFKDEGHQRLLPPENRADRCLGSHGTVVLRPPRRARSYGVAARQQNPLRACGGSASTSGAQLPSLGVIPVVNVLSDLILGEAVAFLDLALQLISLTVYGGKVVVG